MYMNKSIECESGNHDACCSHNDGDDEDYYYEWQCECRCHTKKKRKQHPLSCPNCGSSSVDSYIEDNISGNVASISFTCNDCLSRTSTMVATEHLQDKHTICECSNIEENSCEYIEGMLYCIKCGGLIDDDRL